MSAFLVGGLYTAQHCIPMVSNPLQTLTFYELDLGLNHVVRKYSEPLEERANHLITVPGGNDGPGGVLVCAENYITYKNFGDQPDIKSPIPRRRVGGV